ncbi:OmpA family protein [Vibrio furnissii]|uniref:OmpA family protein n=1 Tax=Vibrio furnissii TaxID=29494 RepID=UPI0024B9CDCA|nr:OmpA family protein [Vibrio furnissii]WHR51690.1 OmpA family protein [Vibrio furnissii]
MTSRSLVIAALSSAAFCVGAADYVVPFDEIQWHGKKADDGCELTVEDRYSGVNVRFESAGGKPLALSLSGRSVASFNQGLIVQSEMPRWGSHDYEETLVNEFTRTPKLITVAQGADFIYRDIVAGAWLTVRDDFHSVTFPTVNMRPALDAFQTCTSALPPISYRQAKTTIFNFQSGVLALTQNQRSQLEAISELVLFDPKIKIVRITGHSDSHGDTVVNLSVSRRRADDVAYWMMMAGVPTEMMEIRGQGGRYPVGNNATEEGRLANRRVEIELVRR